MHGLFSSSIKDLADANLVYVGYCSSDAYIGSLPASSSSPAGFHFMGQHIVSGILDDLHTRHGMGASGSPTLQLLYSGCSAGARGALFNTWRVAAWAQQLNAKFGALLDSAFWIDIAPYGNGPAVTFQTEAQDVFERFNVSGGLNPRCLAKFPGAEGWRCIYGEYAVDSHLEAGTRYFLHAFQYDAFQLPADLGTGKPPATAGELAYAETWRAQTALNATADTITPAIPGTAAMLPGCYK